MEGGKRITMKRREFASEKMQVRSEIKSRGNTRGLKPSCIYGRSGREGVEHIVVTDGNALHGERNFIICLLFIAFFVM